MSLPFNIHDQRPIVVALAGSNGAGKSTFHERFLPDANLRFVNADVFSATLDVTASEAAELATTIHVPACNTDRTNIMHRHFLAELFRKRTLGRSTLTLMNYPESRPPNSRLPRNPTRRRSSSSWRTRICRPR